MHCYLTFLLIFDGLWFFILLFWLFSQTYYFLFFILVIKEFKILSFYLQNLYGVLFYLIFNLCVSKLQFKILFVAVVDTFIVEMGHITEKYKIQLCLQHHETFGSCVSNKKDKKLKKLQP